MLNPVKDVALSFQYLLWLLFGFGEYDLSRFAVVYACYFVTLSSKINFISSISVTMLMLFVSLKFISIPQDSFILQFRRYGNNDSHSKIFRSGTPHKMPSIVARKRSKSYVEFPFNICILRLLRN